MFLDDANRATYTITSQDNLFATNFTVGAVAGSTIDSIIIRINGYGTANTKNGRKIDVALTKNGTSEVGDVVNIELPKNADGDLIFRGSTDDLWGTTWTSTEINATTFGVAINRTNTTSDSLVIDHVQITVWWSTQISGTVYSDEGVTNAGAGLSKTARAMRCAAARPGRLVKSSPVCRIYARARFLAPHCNGKGKAICIGSGS